MRICFFLGAGASAEFGYPVTKQILPLIRSRLRNGTLFSFRQDGQEFGNELEQFLTKLFPGFVDADDNDLPTIVDLLSLFDHSLRYSTAPVRLTPVSQLADLRTLLEVGICEVIRPKSTKSNPAALNFWTWLKSKNDRQQDSVALISTNYDTSIEQLLSQDLGFDRIAREVDFGVSWRDPDRAHPYERPVTPWLRFYKLHGSLNWLRCDMCEHMYMNYKWNIYDRVLDNRIMGKNSCHCGHGKLSLMLATPSYVRDVREPNLLSLWQNALELLRTSNEWVFVGYSLPGDDINIRSMLMRAAQGRHDPPGVTVVLPPHCRNVYARYRLLFPTHVPYPHGFKEYIGHLSRSNL
jgi:NAD-dependent SIR2 family protein deacetylase